MISMVKTFKAGTTQFYNDYDSWLAAIKKKGYYVINVKHGASANASAQDATGCCRGFWGYSLKKGWIEQ